MYTALRGLARESPSSELGNPRHRFTLQRCRPNANVGIIRGARPKLVFRVETQGAADWIGVDIVDLRSEFEMNVEVGLNAVGLRGDLRSRGVRVRETRAQR